jgi:hypothetical protein
MGLDLNQLDPNRHVARFNEDLPAPLRRSEAPPSEEEMQEFYDRPDCPEWLKPKAMRKDPKN